MKLEGKLNEMDEQRVQMSMKLKQDNFLKKYHLKKVAKSLIKIHLEVRVIHVGQDMEQKSVDFLYDSVEHSRKIVA